MKDFPWFKSYPAGIPHEVKLYEYNSVTEIFDESCKKYKDKVAFENMGATLTFGQVDDMAKNFAAYLQQE
ncbi:MAG: long-chain-fatty-acid--CoA ligase, partial [Bacteroidota bacterium]